jgi:hypothetical protein
MSEEREVPIMVGLADGWGVEAISNDSKSEVFFTYCFLCFFQDILQVAVISKFHKFVAETQTKVRPKRLKRV